MQFDNQKTRNVADVVAKILAGESAQQEPQILQEELKGNQHKIDANKNKKIDAHDFKLLRAQKEKEKANSQKFGKDVKEEAEQLDEIGDTPAGKQMLGKYIKKRTKQLPAIERNYQMTPYDDDEPMGAKSIKKYQKKVNKGIGRAVDRLTKEEVEEIDEAKKGMWPGTPEYKAKFGTEREKHEAKYGKSDVKKLPPYGYRDKSEYEKTKDMKEEKSFSAMLESYKEGGLKYIASLVKEEPDNEEYTKEVEDQKAKMDGKKKGGDVAKASVQAVKNEETEIQVINADIANGVQFDNIEEDIEQIDELSKDAYKSYLSKSEGEVKKALGRKQSGGREVGPNTSIPSSSRYAEPNTNRRGTNTNKAQIHAIKKLREEDVELDEREMTDAEMKKREDIVKGMKKGMQGFKQRYGDRAKSVMYATATKQAMKEEKEDHYQKGYDHVRDPIADEPYLDNARERFNELKKQNPHKKGTQEHKDWHAGASTAYEEHKDMLRGN